MCIIINFALNTWLKVKNKVENRTGRSLLSITRWVELQADRSLLR